MKRYIVVSSGTPCDIGDRVHCIGYELSSDGLKPVNKTLTLTQDIIDNLLEQGVLDLAEGEAEREEAFGKYLEAVASKLNLLPDDFTELLISMHRVFPTAIIDMFMLEIAKQLNKEEETPTKEWYYISRFDGRAYQLNKLPSNPNAQEFIPMFKSLEDAEYARTILCTLIEDIYGRDSRDNREQED